MAWAEGLGLACRLGRCFCFAEVSTGHLHPFVVTILTLNGGDSKRLNLQKMRSKDCVEYTLAILAIVW